MTLLRCIYSLKDENDSLQKRMQHLEDITIDNMETSKGSREDGFNFARPSTSQQTVTEQPRDRQREAKFKVDNMGILHYVTESTKKWLNSDDFDMNGILKFPMDGHQDNRFLTNLQKVGTSPNSMSSAAGDARNMLKLFLGGAAVENDVPEVGCEVDVIDIDSDEGYDTVF